MKINRRLKPITQHKTNTTVGKNYQRMSPFDNLFPLNLKTAFVRLNETDFNADDWLRGCRGRGGRGRGGLDMTEFP